MSSSPKVSGCQQLSTKTITFNGKKYYQCQFYGKLLSRRYGIPREGEIGKDRRGTFSDPACAVSWILEQIDSKKMLEEKGRKLLSDIARDLGLDKTNAQETPLKGAPKYNPDQNIPDYSRDMPWMMKPKSGFIHIDSDPSVTDSSKTSKASDEKSEKKKSYIYTLDPEPSEDGKLRSYFMETTMKTPLALDEAITFRKFMVGTYKSKQVILLGEEDLGSNNNSQIDNMFGSQMGFSGRVHLIMQKPLHEDGVEPEESGEIVLQDPKHAKKSSGGNSKSKRDQNVESSVNSILIQSKTTKDVQQQQTDQQISSKKKRKVSHSE